MSTRFNIKLITLGYFLIFSNSILITSTHNNAYNKVNNSSIPIANSFRHHHCGLSPVEMNVVKTFYYSNNGINWKWQEDDILRDGMVWNFTDGSDPCLDHWQGIYCYSSTSCPLHIFSFSLTNYDIYGLISKEIANLTKILILDLSSNHFSGSIPSLVGMEIMYFVNLSYNSLSGTISTNLCELKETQLLYLSNNKLIGTIPECLFRNLMKLEFLYLLNNQLVGTIPNIINMFSNITFLNLGNNYLSGTIPSALNNIKCLKYLYLNNNRLRGSIPDLSDVKYLQQLSLQSNFLTSTIPSFLGSLSNLTLLQLNNNSFYGLLPDSLSNLQSLEVLQLQCNSLSGSLDSIVNSKFQLKLKNIDISDNSITGTLPQEIFNLKSIQTFAAVKNCFKGSLPENICKAKKLLVLALDGLASSPKCSSYISSVTKGYISNPMKGNIPSCLYSLPNITTLHLSGNSFSGSLWDIKATSISKSLTDLTLSFNRFTGTLPSFNIQQFSRIDLSHNKFMGSINFMFYPSPNISVVYNNNQTHLYLEVNRITGKIPQYVEFFTDINILTGNLYSCDSSDDKPKNDPIYSTYLCGSEVYDKSMIYSVTIVATIILFFIITFIIGKFYYRYDKDIILLKMKNLLEAAKSYYSVIYSLGLSFDSKNETSYISYYPYIQNFLISLNLYRILFYYCSLYSISLCLVTYLLLYLLPSNSLYSSHEETYNWISTVVFIKGDIPAILIYWLWTLCCVSIIYMIIHCYYQEEKLVPLISITLKKICDYFFSRENVEYIELSSSQLINKNSESLESFGNNKFEYSNIKDEIVNIFYCILIFSFNTVAMFALNGWYVYYQTSGDISINLVTLLQISVAIFKLFWNIFIVRKLISLLLYRKYTCSLHSMILVFNSIVIPCIATSFFDASCFKELLTGSVTIFSTYSFRTCLEAYQTLEDDKFITVCTHYTNPLYTTQFNPSFNYTYECSSALLIAYIPVYVYTYTILSIFPPIFYFIIAIIKKEYIPGIINTGILQILRPQDWNETKKDFSLFRSNSIQALFVQHITIMLTFGLASPFLAVIICISIIVTTFGWQFIILRFINYNTNRSSDYSLSEVDCLTSELLCEEDSNTYFIKNTMIESKLRKDEKIDELEVICKESWASLIYSYWLVFYFCMLFYCFVLFDIIGDSHGLEYAILVPLIIAFTIVFVRFTSFDIVYFCRARFRKYK